MPETPTREELLRQLEEVRRERDEARETLEAIRSGSADALVVHTEAGMQVYTLQGAEHTYRVLLETLNEGAMTLDSQGTILYANRRFAELVGAPLERVIGSELARYVAPASAPQVADVLRRATEAGAQEEVALRRPDGTEVPVLLSASCVPGNGIPEATVAVATDLSELRGAQQRTAELRSEVDERRRIEEMLREEDRRKDEFLAMLSHELRNPLAAIAGAVHLLQQKNVPETVAERARGAAERQIGHMRRLLDDLLDVARIRTGRIVLRKERVALSRVVEDAVALMRPLMDERRHQLSVSLPPRPVYLDVDPTRITQVFGNLLSNAAKFTEPGGRIWVAAQQTNGEVTVRVRDTGAGISAELLPRVFDLFTQASQGLGRPQGGLGIGLALVRRLVELHGGSVEAHSEGLGKGSEFVVHLPAAEPSAREQAPAPEGGAHPLRILLVEDNADVADMLAELLEMEGHEVVIAGDGITALRLAPEYRPDVVLLDIGLPGMDGYEVGRRLRQELGLTQTALIALTGYGHEEDQERSRAAGFNRHLVKPVDMQELNEALAEVSA